MKFVTIPIPHVFNTLSQLFGAAYSESRGEFRNSRFREPDRNPGMKLGGGWCDVEASNHARKFTSRTGNGQPPGGANT